MIYSDHLSTPIGYLMIKASEKHITEILFADTPLTESQPNRLTNQCKQQLGEYFNGQRKKFDLPLEQAGTPFQKSVWNSLLTIPYGQSASYADIATAINNPKAVRAVGSANGRNKLSIVVPCHRVIGANGTLTGYAGGLNRKAWLLKHEAIDFK